MSEFLVGLLCLVVGFVVGVLVPKRSQVEELKKELEELTKASVFEQPRFIFKTSHHEVKESDENQDILDTVERLAKQFRERENKNAKVQYSWDKRYLVMTDTKGAQWLLMGLGEEGVQLQHHSGLIEGGKEKFVPWKDFMKSFQRHTVRKSQREPIVSVPKSEYDEMKKSWEEMNLLYGEVNNLKIPDLEEEHVEQNS